MCNNQVMSFLLQDVGVTWFREEDYPALLQVFEDADMVPRTWKLWLGKAEQMERQARALGYNTQRIYIDPDGFAEWCLREGMRANSEGRQKFAWTWSPPNMPIRADLRGIAEFACGFQALADDAG